VSGAGRITCGAAHVDSVVDDFVATFKSGDPDFCELLRRNL
jgi:hypothetical protein